MECERLVKLVKTWYMQVQDEALAPARMVAFLEKHIFECEACMMDPAVRQEVKKIIELVLPPSKIRTPKKNKVADADDDLADIDDDEVIDSDEEEEESDDDEDDEEDDEDEDEELEDDLDDDLII
ncbi:MAG: hypothetical protein KKE17_14460 [Proteobacteria bacterium]|nr:hypothetical protein [Pseudomonadota bacterium]